MQAVWIEWGTSTGMAEAFPPLKCTPLKPREGLHGPPSDNCKERALSVVVMMMTAMVAMVRLRERRSTEKHDHGEQQGLFHLRIITITMRLGLSH
jgi:hypothetical protein